VLANVEYHQKHKKKERKLWESYQKLGNFATIKLDKFNRIKAATSIEEIAAMEPSACEGRPPGQAPKNAQPTDYVYQL